MDGWMDGGGYCPVSPDSQCIFGSLRGVRLPPSSVLQGLYSQRALSVGLMEL